MAADRQFLQDFCDVFDRVTVSEKLFELQTYLETKALSVECS